MRARPARSAAEPCIHLGEKQGALEVELRDAGLEGLDRVPRERAQRSVQDRRVLALEQAVLRNVRAADAGGWSSAGSVGARSPYRDRRLGNDA